VDNSPAPADFHALAASLRASSADLAVFARVLAGALEEAMPGRVRVERRRAGLFSRERRPVRLEADLGGALRTPHAPDGQPRPAFGVRYLLDLGGGRVRASRATVVRGIVLRTDELGLDDWITAFARDLSGEAAGSEASRVALQRLLRG
jgi:hypothetical protein